MGRECATTTGMEEIRRGVLTFQRRVFPRHRKLFERLALGQSPKALFITCADSRVDPTLITHSEPGELFVDRNPGNFLPPFHGENASEAAGIEYALEALNIPNIIICGHTDCGAMKAVWQPEKAKELRAVTRWLKNGVEARKRVMKRKLPETEQLAAITQQNVVLQLEHLKTYPAVRQRLKTGKLRIAGWVYDIEHGKVLEYDAAADRFVMIKR
jgi:carbonic anhydrase